MGCRSVHEGASDERVPLLWLTFVRVGRQSRGRTKGVREGCEARSASWCCLTVFHPSCLALSSARKEPGDASAKLVGTPRFWPCWLGIAIFSVQIMQGTAN